jgi:hypothetical protein
MGHSPPDSQAAVLAHLIYILRPLWTKRRVAKIRKKTRELHVPDFENEANAVVGAHEGIQKQMVDNSLSLLTRIDSMVIRFELPP